MLQSLDVISINLWLSLISLANLVILFLLVKKFLFKPVEKIINLRNKEIEDRYKSAKLAETEANENKKDWEEKLKGAKHEADLIVSEASTNAKLHSEKIVNEAKQTAERIINNAESTAELEYKKAADTIKKEIVEISGEITKKILEREINTNDHRNLISSFIEEIGDGND